MTDERVESANERLQREHGAHRGSAKKPRKGKERAGPARFTATNARPVTSGFDGSHQDEVSFPDTAQVDLCVRVITDDWSWTVKMIQEVISEFLAET